MATTMTERAHAGTAGGIARHGERIMQVGGWAITVTLAVIFIWFGGMKFIPFERESITGLIANNPLLSWMHAVFGVAGAAKFLGCFEILTGLLIAGRLINPVLSAVGGAMGAWAFFLTITCMFTTPGVIQPGWEGTLALSPSIGAFLVKDIVLFAASLWLLGASLTEVRARQSDH